MKVPLFFSLLWLWGSTLSGIQAEQPAIAAVQTVKHSSTLKFLKGKYTSIFGIVPKNYSLESVETREILQSFESDEAFTLSLVSSETRRILSIPEESPTVESASKPLTGKVLRVFKKGDGWDYEIVGYADPKEEEKKEAQRLVNRFQPGATPFKELAWSSEGTVAPNLPVLLKFLGYPQANALQGQAQLKKSAGEANGLAELEFSASFEAGEKLARTSVEITGKGSVVLSESAWGYDRVSINGILTIHGQRELSDGRKVPYSLVTPFSYETGVVKVSPP